MSLRQGDQLPALTLSDLGGNEVELAALRGEATLLVFLRHLA
jgi:peroxiredoxin